MPQKPPSLLGGKSLRNARALVEKVKREVEAESIKTRVPAGAPQRAGADFTVLSSREKIQHGLGLSSS